MDIFHILLVVTLQLSGTSAACDNNWFGPRCRFRCLCDDQKCKPESDGVCVDTVACKPIYFGPGCQFRNIVNEFGISASNWAVDTKHTTCQPNQNNPEPVSILFKISFEFLWLRLIVLNLQAAFNVTFNMGTLPCTFQRVYVASSTEIDVTCGVSSKVGEVSIHGEILKHLCEVAVSGGENLAIMQYTNQSSTSGSQRSSLAVDGNSTLLMKYGSYAQTVSNSAAIATWNLFYEQPTFVHRVLVIVGDSDMESMAGFILTTYGPNNKILETYRESGQTKMIHDIYLKQTAEMLTRISIVATHKDNILTLSEVETFGKRICPRGKWGFDCDKDCRCQERESCFAPTGACSVGCPLGFFGPACDKRCSINCDDTGCSEDLGVCYGCDDGYTGAKCSQACPSGKYGYNCLMTCSASCSESRCHHVTGGCLSCPEGYYGTHCTTKCPEECGNNGCHAHNGRCMSCPTGLYKDTCNAKCIKNCADAICNQDTGYCGTDCPPKTFGDKCLLNCTEHCETCNNAKCLKCDIGYYGDMCSHACPEICEEISCGLKKSTSVFSRLENVSIKILGIVFGVALLLLTIVFIITIMLCRNTSSDVNDAKTATPKEH